jgi:predicted acylesterase/phospholipase RssA
MAALDRLDDLEDFLMALQPADTFRPNRLWRLPFLGLHDYALPQTIERWFGDLTELARELRSAPVELVVVATDVSDIDASPTGFELTYSSRTAEPEELGRAVVASAAVSALVLPVRVGEHIATDGAWVRNFPLAHAYAHDAVELIVAFRYVPRYPRLGTEAMQPLKRRLSRFRKVPPIRAFLAELEEAEARAARGEPAHLADMIVRLARVAILRNTQTEERTAETIDRSLRELRSLRQDVLALVEDEGLRAQLDERFAAARFPFRHDRIVPRIVVRGSTDEASLDPGFRNQPHWTDEEKRTLIALGERLADRELSALEPE